MTLHVGLVMKTNKEELTIRLPTALLEAADKVIECRSFKDRDDLICYVLWVYIDKLKQVDALKAELKIEEENL